MTEDEYLTTQEAADILGVSRRTVSRMCQNRLIKHLRLTPHRVVIAKSWLAEYVEAQTKQPINLQKENENNE